MYGTVLLLTGSVEQAALSEILRRHNPRLTVFGAETLQDLEKLDPGVLRRVRLIGFATPTVVPARILQGLGYGAYNFHPGPPHYPGWAPAHFALYEQAAEFGATAHVMTERVDSGPIVDVVLF